MSNNKQQQKSFANIITKKKYDRLDNPDQFEIDNEIRIPTTYDIELPEGDVFSDTSMLLNPLLVDQIYNAFIFDKKIENNCQFNNHTDKILIKLRISKDDNNRIKLLNKEYKKYSNKLYKIDLIEDFYSIDNSLNLKSKEFIKLIKGTISFDYDIYIDFLTEGLNMNFYNHWLFREWNKIELYLDILEYLKEKINLLQHKSGVNLTTNNKATTKQQRINNNSPTCDNVYFSRVFPSPEAENYLFEILNEYNVLKKDKTVDKGYQGYCDSFWRVGLSNKYSGIIFKPNVKKAWFLEHLNKRYNAQIKETSKGKLTDGSQYDNDIKKDIDIYLKEPKQNNL
ncbi:MAG: hypothetical protein JKY69_03580 [Flavobacteriaceae bacterium]|nr:hypothetical protein [Flavobacteriaceae bacterium]MBL4905792.1 hypothetical protein [Flavobacteriaceae bacterium]